MPPTVLCVPNVSEGRDQSVIRQIAGAVEATTGATLLDVDSGEHTNRTVITFAGSPEPVGEATFGLIATVARLIDMSGHTGSHARIGAADVCPFVPVADVSLQQCVELAKSVGRRVGEELGIAVYLYGYAATRPERIKLADIRAGEYEGLPKKLKDPAFAPDFGPAAFNARSGATVIGVRNFLLAYNVNLDTTDVSVAREVASIIRETGRLEREAGGQVVRDDTGQPVRIPGKLPGCQAGGWFVEAYGCAQVTMNLPDFSVSGLHTAFEAVRKEAAALGAGVTGSELVGLAPRQALLEAGRFYLRQQGRTDDVSEQQLIQAAVLYLGLADKTPFDPGRKIVEYRLADLLED